MTTRGPKSSTKKLDLIRVIGLPPVGRAVTVTGMTLTETMSKSFEGYLEVVPSNPSTFDLDQFAAAVLGQPLGVGIRPSNHAGDGERFFHGDVAAVHLNDAADKRTAPQIVLELRPTLWRLSRSFDTRLFTDKTAKEVVTAVLDAHGLAGHYRWHAGPDDKPRKRDHCWQYRETNLHFVERLLEEDGYLYWFTFTSTGHKVNIATGPQRLPVIGGKALKLGRIGSDGAGQGKVGYLRRSLTADR